MESLPQRHFADVVVVHRTRAARRRQATYILTASPLRLAATAGSIRLLRNRIQPLRAMSLRSRIAWLLVGLSIALVVTMYAVQLLVVMPTFVDLERSEAERDVSRCVDALKRELESISNMTNDWASRDDGYQFAKDHNAKFQAANLVDESFSNSHLNLIGFVDLERRLVWGEVQDAATKKQIDVPDLFAAIQRAGSPLSTPATVDSTVTGVLLTSKGPMLLASRPIITTKHRGPIRGSLIMGRFLSPIEVKNLAARTHVTLKVWTVGQANMPAEVRRIVAEHATSSETYIETIDSQTLHAYRMVSDVYGNPAMVWRLDVPRVISAQGRVAIRVATLCSLLGGAATLTLMWIVLQRGVVNPLRQLAAHTVEVGRSGNLKARLNLSRTDEIGALADEFDSMVEHLAESRRKVLDSAHRSGMEEVASEVLHNVGNAVNSASCSVETLRERLHDSKISGFARAAELLHEQSPHAAEFFGGDPRGAMLIDYIIGLNGALQDEHSDEQREVDRLFDTVRHIRDVIAAQQTYTGHAEFRQDVSLSSLVEDVLLLSQDQLRLHSVVVDVELPALPDLHLNKSKVTQVLVNLVRNSVEAMQDQASGARRLTISARTIDETGLEIEVCDTGHGFDDNVRDKVFAHGFTTKLSGNGFGLHYCANAIHGGGGQITAESPGPGEGATFRVRLPQVMPMAAAAT